MSSTGWCTATWSTFLQFHWRFLAPMFPGGYFPAFNLADSAITLGAICLIWDELRRVRRG